MPSPSAHFNFISAIFLVADADSENNISVLCLLQKSKASILFLQLDPAIQYNVLIEAVGQWTYNTTLVAEKENHFCLEMSKSIEFFSFIRF